MIMNRIARSMFLNFFFLILLSIGKTAFAASTPVDPGLAAMLKKATPAIVHIKAKIKITDFAMLYEILRQQQVAPQRFARLPKYFNSTGSGVIVDAKNGYILTNAHVIRDAQRVTVTLADGRHFKAKVLGLDRPSDVALMKIDAKNLTAIPIGNSNNLKVGDVVAAIGNPFGLTQTVTSGIVSALGRTTLGIENYESFIQTDAPINPGNSGGALVDTNGKLIGINTAILSAQSRGSIGIGFAIPSNMAKSIMNQFLKYGNIRRGVLGIGAQDITPDLVTAFNVKVEKGAAVTQILPDSPASGSGIKIGDIITSVNNIPINKASDVVNTIGFMRMGTKLDINVLRDNKKMVIHATLADPKKREEVIEKADPYFNGVAMKDFSALSPQHGSVNGVMILSVKDESNAWQSDLRPGDIITSANQKTISSIEQLKAAAKKADKLLLLNVIRGPSAIFLVINKPSQ
jgi:serine protease Do